MTQRHDAAGSGAPPEDQHILRGLLSEPAAPAATQGQAQRGADPPSRSSSIELSADKKVEVLLSLMESFRSQIMAWHDRAYAVATTSLGLLLFVTKQWIDAPNKNLIYLGGYIIVILIFSWLTEMYLKAAHDAYNGNEQGKIQCEYALRLKESGAYFHNERVFWAPPDPQKDRGMPANDIERLRYGYRIATLLLILICVGVMAV